MITVAIIDDNKPTADRIAYTIPWESLGCEVVAVEYDGLQGKRAIAQHLPNLIIIDIRMPYLSGLETIEFTRPLIPDSKVVFISAYDEFEYAFRAIKLKAYDYLIKPFSQNDLMKVITKVVNELNLVNVTTICSTSHQSTIVQRVIEYSDNHISENITLKNMSRLFGISSGHLSQLIRQETGKRFGELATQLRVEKAKTLLINSEYNVGEIGTMVGYKNYLMFYKAFRKQEDISPTEYARKMRNQAREKE